MYSIDGLYVSRLIGCLYACPGTMAIDQWSPTCAPEPGAHGRHRPDRRPPSRPGTHGPRAHGPSSMILGHFVATTCSFNNSVATIYFVSTIMLQLYMCFSTILLQLYIFATIDFYMICYMIFFERTIY